MDHSIKFYPIGIADCTLFKLASGKTIIIDFGNECSGDSTDPRCDLAKELKKDIASDYVDVVGFTHADIDHVKGFHDYFFLEHASKYQSGDRKKIKDLWVPAHVILEEGCDDETKILRAEARHRLRQKKGIKVFSKPSKLKAWLDSQGIALDDVKHLIVDAGKMVPGWDESNAELAFFSHAPFAFSADQSEVDRNEACLVLQGTFTNIHQTKIFMTGDADWQLLHEIVKASERFGNTNKLRWDIFHISHHCSYLSLSPEKGELVTRPVDPVKSLLEDYGQEGCILISPSCIIPTDPKAVQPPHLQAFNYYKALADTKNGEIKVTMEWPSKDDPKPLEIVINNYGATIIKTFIASAFVSSKQPPKAG